MVSGYQKAPFQRTGTDMKPLSQEDREYLNWLTRIECRAIIPLKWTILVVGLAVWFWSTHFSLPSTEVFMLFFLYAMFNIAQSYFFYARRVTLVQVKPFCYISYSIDIAFVTLLIYLDTTRYYGSNVQSDFYILYFFQIIFWMNFFILFSRDVSISKLLPVIRVKSCATSCAFFWSGILVNS